MGELFTTFKVEYRKGYIERKEYKALDIILSIIVVLNYDRAFILRIIIDLINLFDNIVFNYSEKVFKNKVKYILKGYINYISVKLYINTQGIIYTFIRIANR